MFDDIIIEFPLPNKPDWVEDGHRFQTKNLECYLYLYRITPGGRLIVRRTEGDYNDKGEFHTSREWFEDTFYHGDINFYTNQKGTQTWLEYKARFTNGQLYTIERVE